MKSATKGMPPRQPCLRTWWTWGLQVVELPGFEGRLRLDRARNSQKKGVRVAADYAPEQWSAAKLRRICREAHVDLLA